MTDTSTDAIVNETPAVIRWLLGGQIRHLMVALGTFMLAKGVLPDNTTEEAFVNWGVNGALIVIGLGWSFMNTKSQTAAKEVQTDVDPV